jgi:hypothetical protein
MGLLILALASCVSSPMTEPHPPATGPGDMELAENTGRDCEQQSPWCGYDLRFDGTALVVTSRSTPATGTGTLTAVGLQELERLVADVPYDSPDDVSSTCTDAPIVRLHVTFDEVGPRTFQYACEPGMLAALGSLVTRLASAVINYESDGLVVVDAPF